MELVSRLVEIGHRFSSPAIANMRHFRQIEFGKQNASFCACGPEKGPP